MGIHLIYRTPYKERNHKYYKKFNENSLLEWFQSFWKFYEDDFYEFDKRIQNYIGENIYGFWGPLSSMINTKDFNENKSNPDPPISMDQVQDYIKNGYIEKLEVIGKSAIQVLTEDDELDLAYYIFDDNYCSKNPAVTRYLTHSEWELPEGYLNKSDFRPSVNVLRKLKRGNENGTTYIVISSNWMSGGNLCDLEGKVYEIEGIRLDSFSDYLITQKPDENWCYDLLFLRSQVDFNDRSIQRNILNYDNIPDFYIQNIPSLELMHNFELKRFKDENFNEGKDYLMSYYKSNFVPSKMKIRRDKNEKSSFQFSEHLVQASIYTESWESHPTHDVGKNFPLYYHYLIFDDLWATNNSDLANSILNYGLNWNVLK